MQQPTPISPSSRAKPFYGWFALAGAMLVVFVSAGAFMNSLGVFLPFICDEFGWSRGSFSLVMSFGIMAFGLPSPLFGMFVARFKPRVAIIAGNILAGLGFMALWFVDSLWQMYILYAIIGFGAGAGGYIACATVVVNWFIKRRPLALGMLLSCGSLSGFAFPPVTTWLLETIGWRWAWFIWGALLLFFGVIVGGIILVRNHPSDMGQVPDGVTEGSSLDQAQRETERQESTKESSGAVIRKLLKTRMVWITAAMAVALAFTIGTLNTHQAAFLQDYGLTAMAAATVISVVFAMSVLGNLTFGVLAMRYSIRPLILGGFVMQGIALCILLMTQAIGMLYVYAVIVGLANGALATSIPTAISSQFSGRWYSQALSLVIPFQIISQAIAASVGGLIYDTTGSYTTAFIMLLGFISFGIITQFIPRKTSRQIA